MSPTFLALLAIVGHSLGLIAVILTIYGAIQCTRAWRARGATGLEGKWRKAAVVCFSAALCFMFSEALLATVGWLE
jgi:TRAP-type C4-dicarboxylate transport system permease small subunit